MKRGIVIPEETRRDQARASDPRSSAWVSANAGSGKTHVLAQRVIRLLLDGTDPAKILCLTYTRAAASNMGNRIFDNLARWTGLDDAALAAEIEAMGGGVPAPAKLAEARRLFARALETPGGLKIQTIHAFCEAVLHQFPLEANIAGHFELLDGAMEAALVAEARRDLIAGAAGGADAELAEAFAVVLSAGREFGLASLLDEIVRCRDGLRAFIDQVAPEPFPVLAEEFGFRADETEADIAAACWPLPGFSRPQFAAFEQVAREAGARNVLNNVLPGLAAAFAETDPVRRLEHLREGLLKKDGAAYDTGWLFTRALCDRLPDLADRYQAAVMAVTEAADRLALLRTLRRTAAALVLADRLIARYERLKAARGFLDFNDLIQRTIRLLARPDAGAWVQYKLDRGIDHILVDEAQDTSPEQWQVVERLAEEFFAGLGAREALRRTVFAVGDEKQSIYSFQGAEPEAFDRTGREFAARVAAAEQRFERVRLQRSFRSTDDVLAVVDMVFARDAVRRGLTRDPEPIRHSALRNQAPGYVELWPTIGETAVQEPEDWRQPVDHASAPAVRIAEAVAETIAGWLREGEIIEGKGRRLTAGDVMVLVRKRGPFVHALSRSLKSRQIPVAGADRLRLQDHIAVKDLMALGRFVLQPDDDLSLASLLKSPAFGLSEEALLGLAAGRPRGTSLFAVLRGRAAADPGLAAVVETLSKWRREADFSPVFEFYAAILARDGVRRAMIARLGHEAGEILDEFLNFCLAGERAGLAGLEAFLATLESAGPEIKREMDQTRNEIRIMTVHAAKGLEAPVVFLVDGGSAPFSEQHMPRLMPFRSRDANWTGNGYLWRSGRETANSALARLEAEARLKAEEEYRRLLYVGMTRAEDRLIVCGYHGKRQPGDMTWHSILRDALAGADCERRPFLPGEDRPILRHRATGPVPPSLAAQEPDEARPARTPAELPPGFLDPLPPSRALPRPLAPSGASLVADGDAEPPPPRVSPVLAAEARPGLAIERGIATHRLLQMLPGLDPAAREAAAARYLARIGAAWPEGERERVWKDAARVLDDAGFAPLFAPGSRAEVSLMGMLTVRGQERAISGKIDRLAVAPDQVLIVDYKTGRAPDGLSEVPDAYILQLALYRALLRPLYPGRPVRAALLFAEAPSLIALPEAVMGDALARLARP